MLSIVNTRPAPSLTRAKPGPVHDTMWLGVCPLWTVLTSGWETQTDRFELLPLSLNTVLQQPLYLLTDLTFYFLQDDVCVFCTTCSWNAKSNNAAFTKTRAARLIARWLWSQLWILNWEKQLHLMAWQYPFQCLFSLKTLKLKTSLYLHWILLKCLYFTWEFPFYITFSLCSSCSYPSKPLRCFHLSNCLKKSNDLIFH